MKKPILHRYSKYIVIYVLSSAFLLLSNQGIAVNGPMDSPTTVTVKQTSAAFSIELCQRGSCTTLPASQAMLDALSEGYTEISTADLTQDGIAEIIMTSAEEGSVNICSVVYRYNIDAGAFTALENLPLQLCNYGIEHNRIVSSYRSGAKWYEDVYKVQDNNLVLELTDSCIGCDYSQRTIYLTDGNTQQLLVSSNRDFTLRTPLTTTVISAKAVLYKAPSLEQSSRMHLIQGDEVTLTDFNAAQDDTFWYQISYSSATGKVINGWLKCNDIAFCAE